MAEGVGVLTLLPVTSPAFPFLLSFLPSLPTPTPLPRTHWCWVSLVRGRSGEVDEVDAKSTHIDLSRLAKFQTPNVFDRDFEICRSTFYRSPKIMKIFIYVFYIHENVSYNLI